MEYLPKEVLDRHETYRLALELQRRQLNISLFEKQVAAMACTDRRIALNVGRRGGKTECLVAKLASEAINYPNRNFLFIAKSMDSARNIVWNKFARILGDKPGVTLQGHDYQIKFANGSVIRLGGADKDPDVHRGQAYHIVVVDEAAFIRDLDYLLQEVLEPALLDYGGTLYVSSSPYGMNKFWEICQNKAWTTFHWTAYDNPHIRSKELDRIKEQYGANSIVWEQEYMGRFVRHDGLIFKNFRTEEPYIIAPIKPTPQWRTYLVIDPGTTAPTGYVILQHDPFLDKVYAVKAKNLKTGGDIGKVARVLQLDMDLYNNPVVICDGHATHIISELQSHYGIPVVAWTKKDVMGSYSRLISRIEKKSFQIFEGTCKDLEQEILEAEWKPTRDIHDESGKVLGSDHCLDATRYGNEYIFFKEQERTRVYDDGLDELERKLMAKLKKQKEDGEWDEY